MKEADIIMVMSVEEAKAKLDGHEIAVQCILINLKKSTTRDIPHYHDYIELLYAINGSINIWIGGKQYIFEKGDLVVINSKEAHDLQSISDISQYIVVKFMPQLLYTGEQSIFELKYILPFILSDFDHQRLFKKSEFSDTLVNDMMLDILNEWRRKEYGYELAMRANILRVFLWILRYWQKQNIYVLDKFKLPDELTQAIQKSVEYTSAHYKDISCDEVAKMCNLSYSYFCRSFKKIMNMSFSEYVNYIRITVAERLLVTTELSMSEIAEEVGFSTSSYFIQQFKTAKGESPKQFRLNLHSQIE